MYLDIADRLKIELSNVFAIGDSPRDIKASLASGCKPLGVRTGNGEKISKNYLIYRCLMTCMKL